MIVCTQRNWWEGEKRSQRRARSNKETEERRRQEMLWESSLCCFHTGFLLSLLPFPVPEELIYSSTHTSHNSPLCVYFPSWSAKYSLFLFWLWVLVIFMSEFICNNRWFSVSLSGNCIDHHVPLCIQYVKSDLCLVKHNEPLINPPSYLLLLPFLFSQFLLPFPLHFPPPPGSVYKSPLPLLPLPPGFLFVFWGMGWGVQSSWGCCLLEE